ncbi:uncharacterized protein LOC122265695 [Penaeus japonicus]|uniref:uncharacterized protein LOC122245696 n=1 Tax=Penaeus japonicus TaxID=27405 RepID=UPI001C70BC29|nr:uncharacterized protein LOC122245696 [Penaeus japonicus]XP_042891031.1 uncharacterized protein LOC122265695 [Penaeus japonicus]
MEKAVLYLLVVGLSTAQVLISPESRQCRDLAALDEAIPSSNLMEYTAGELMEVKAEIPETESGVFEFYLCPETGPEDEECLVKMPLNIAGGMGKKFDLAKIPQSSEYTIPLELPEDVACERCTLLWMLIQNFCPEDVSQPCISTTATMCSDVAIVKKKQQQKRDFGDFFKGVFQHAINGAARGIAGCGRQ